jgi:hypothetical protein
MRRREGEKKEMVRRKDQPRKEERKCSTTVINSFNYLILLNPFILQLRY